MTTVEEPVTTDRGTDAAVQVEGLWKIFGPRADKIIGTPDADLPRAELKEKTGCVAGVKDVSFEVAPGEVFVVMGLSGSGKSTLVRCLTRLIEPTAGTVQLDGVDVTKASDSRAARPAPQAGLDGVPALRAAAAPAGDRQRRLRAGDPRHGQEGAAREGGRGRLAGRPRRIRDVLPGPALRRHAAAGRPGPSAGGRARHPALRRAVLRARPADPPRHAERGDPAPPTSSARPWSSSPTTSRRRSSSATGS